MTRYLLRFLGTASISILSAACGSSVEGTGGKGAGGDTGTTSTTSTSGTTSTTGSTTESTTFTTGTMCGGFMGKPCAANEFCDYPDDICGAADGSGFCKKRPPECPNNFQPTCGCDGTVHGNPCDANSSGFDVNVLGGCTPPNGMFPCGSTFCELGLHYCEQVNSDIGGEPNTYSCKQLAPLCEQPPGCGCLKSVPCGDNCSMTPEGGLKVTCLGG